MPMQVIMTVETELKLRLAPEHAAPAQIARLKRHPVLKAHQVMRASTHRLYSIYYDTPELKLHAAGVALRLRRAGRQWVQTLKGGGSVQGGLHRRNEWEVPASGPVPDWGGLQHNDYIELFDKALLKKLIPVFVTDFMRNSRILNWQGAQIELCIDAGEISTGHAHLPLCELELELKSGEPQQLYELALALLDMVPFELEACSKAEQGYRLFGGEQAKPLKAAAVTLKKQQPLGAAMQTLLWSVLQQVQGNLHGMMAGEDAEYLHQLRVALRRLRVLLRMAAGVQEDEQLDAFRRDFAALCSALGRVREWDVFIATTLQPMRQHLPQDAALHALEDACRQQRTASFQACLREMPMQAWQRLLLRFGWWMHGPYWRAFSQTGTEVQQFAHDYLAKLAGRFERAAANAEHADHAGLHAMRIQAKKLRYAAEFFASLYGRRRMAKYLRALSAVQEVLGQINDDAVTSHLLDQLARLQELSQQQEAIVLVRGWVAHELAQQLMQLQGLLLKFREQHAFD